MTTHDGKPIDEDGGQLPEPSSLDERGGADGADQGRQPGAETPDAVFPPGAASAAIDEPDPVESLGTVRPSSVASPETPEGPSNVDKLPDVPPVSAAGTDATADARTQVPGGHTRPEIPDRQEPESGHAPPGSGLGRLNLDDAVPIDIPGLDAGFQSTLGVAGSDLTATVAAYHRELVGVLRALRAEIEANRRDIELITGWHHRS